MEGLRVILVDDHPVVLEGLQNLMASHPAFTTVKCCSGGAEALQALRERRYDAMLLDMRMTPMSGVETLRLAKKQQPGLAVLILSSYELDEEIFQAMQAGATGYLSKASNSADIVHSIMHAVAGKLKLSEPLLRRFEMRKRRRDLSQREQQILEMVCRGLTNKEVGHALGVSHFTVRNQFSVILEKLDVSDRAEAVRVAIEQGVIVL